MGGNVNHTAGRSGLSKNVECRPAAEENAGFVNNRRNRSNFALDTGRLSIIHAKKE
jgi:hypothetical protein